MLAIETDAMFVMLERENDVEIGMLTQEIELFPNLSATFLYLLVCDGTMI